MPINCASKNIWSGCSGRLHVKKSPIKPLAGYRTNYLPKIERNSHCNRMGCNAWIRINTDGHHWNHRLQPLMNTDKHGWTPLEPQIATTDEQGRKRMENVGTRD